MRLAVNKATQQSWRRHRFTKGIAILLPVSLDTWQSTLQVQLHSYLENLVQQWFNALMLLLYLYVKKHNNFVTNKQDFLSYNLISSIYVLYKFYLVALCVFTSKSVSLARRRHRTSLHASNFDKQSLTKAIASLGEAKPSLLLRSPLFAFERHSPL
ncbi:hypothetical protein [Nostoc favosum]|uniref:Transposase n=1 Tax=Nostoc favosum CHAB5714 TaxID=2780399 RepID=A0ABS8I8L6_9NOSO|nr:hypothetical protein [Nostoc favosum]MCC5600211.1 hypothetical protein [Nostoc favosum CHAB5714]